MSKKMQLSSIVGAAVMLSAMSAVVHAEVNPFETQEVAASMQLAGNDEGKCGAAHGAEAKGDHEGKCGEGTVSPPPAAPAASAEPSEEAHGEKGE